ncbi:uncharacterized protein MKZ38_004699 [Zalerion maritima]|uniref:Uncharacterized protein n=1 Tax=Zalerion maritima TaxID=339359 RepID=A0AAD5RL57_9PEZI|nr:uncharacterized protein MKZ38_004699 [Zalerion maritima]
MMRGISSLSPSRTTSNSSTTQTSSPTRNSRELRTSSRKPAATRDEDAIALYNKWKITKDRPITYTPANSSPEPWNTKAAHAFVLAVELHNRDFERYALSQFVQNCGFMPFGPWTYIEKTTELYSAVRLFSNHWVAWNLKISDGHAKEYEGLAAANLVDQVPREVRDPRIYDLEHWYELCGHRFHTGCQHDPIMRQERMLAAANKRAKAPLPEVGGDEEQRMQQETAAPTEPRSPV